MLCSHFVYDTILNLHQYIPILCLSKWTWSQSDCEDIFACQNHVIVLFLLLLLVNFSKPNCLYLLCVTLKIDHSFLCVFSWLIFCCCWTKSNNHHCLDFCIITPGVLVGTPCQSDQRSVHPTRIVRLFFMYEVCFALLCFFLSFSLM